MNSKNKKIYVTDLINQGLSPKEIADILGIHQSSFYNYCKRNNLKHNGKGKKYFGGKNIKDMTNIKYGKLTGIKKIEEYRKNSSAYWEFLCDCGKTCISKASEVRRGKIKSCGCSKKYLRIDKRKYHAAEFIQQRLWKQINMGAQSRKIDFAITADYANEILKKQNFKCSLTGLEINALGSNITASLDRIDSSKGYIEGNIQWLHKDINIMKWDFDQEKFIEYCKLVANNDSNITTNNKEKFS